MSAELGILMGITQGVMILVLAPLVYGFHKKLVARLQQRVGPPITQPLRDIRKLWSKREESRPNVHTWVYSAVPVLFMACMLTIVSCLPVFVNVGIPLADIILIIYIFALIRFILSVGAFDTGSPFAAVGAWRENTVAVLIEILMLFALFIPALECGSTSLYAIVECTQENWVELWTRPSYIVSACILFMCLIIESGTLPFDVAEAEQEIQEGILQEYSGGLLATMQYSHMIKKLALITLFLDVYIPFGIALTMDPASILVGIVAYIVKVFVFMVILTIIVVSNARIRFIDLHKLLKPLFVFMVCGLICYLLGW